jgi:hypothetical protein
MLQLGSHWSADARQLDLIRKEITSRHPELDAASIRLSAAKASVQKVALALGDGAGKFEELKTSVSSGYPPFAAIFSLKLNAAQKDGVVACLNGREQFLKVAYQVSFARDVAVRVTICGNVKTELDALPREATLEDCLKQVDDALAKGRLEEEISEEGPVPAELRARAERMTREKAANLLLTMLQRPPADPTDAELAATVGLGDTVTTADEKSTDVAGWFPDGSGSDHVRVLPGVA